MYDLLLPPDDKELKGVLEIFKKESDEVRSVSPAVFFVKAVLKIFRKFPEKTFVTELIFRIFVSLRSWKIR